MNCQHIEELLPAYALGALDPTDRQEVEEHLRTCPYCPPQAQEYQEVAGMLASLVPAAVPSPPLRHRLLAQVAAPAATFAATRQAETLWRGPRIRRPRLGLAAVAAAASLSLLLLAALLNTVLGLQEEMRSLRRENQRLFTMLDEQRNLSYITALPGVETMLLENTGQVPKARGMLMVSQDRTWGMLVSQGLEPLHTSLAYQVWLSKDGERMSGGIFTVDQVGYGQTSIKFPVPYEELGGIGITKEPSQGSTGPTSPAVLSGKMHPAQSDLVQGDW